LAKWFLHFVLCFAHEVQSAYTVKLIPALESSTKRIFVLAATASLKIAGKL